MQLRAGIVYIVLFMVVTAGAYAVIATAESPQVTIDEADADYQLEAGDDVTIGELTYNVSELDGAAGTGTLEHVDDEAVLDTTWSGASALEGDSWDSGDAIQFEEDGEEYYVYIYAPPGEEVEEDDDEDEADDDDANDEAEDENGDTEGENGDGDEAEDENGDAEDENGDADEAEDEEADDEETDDVDAQPEAFLLIEAFDDDDMTVVERADGVYVAVENEDGEEVLRSVTEIDDIDTVEVEVGDSVTFYEEEMEAQVDGEVTELETDSVTLEYIGEEVTSVSLEHNQAVLIEGEEFGVHFPSEDVVYLTEDVESFEAQHDAVEEHEERIHGLWWVIGLSISMVIILAGLAFMPTRG
ncbi:hypothetical protein ACLI4Q_19360 [Natrialbaceae archaeon A-CW1-1]